MTRPHKVGVVGRRDVLVGAGAGLLLLALGRQSALAQDAKGPQPVPPPQLTPYEQALDTILGHTKPQATKIAFEIPEIAENGNTVPYAITIDSPMTPADHVKTVHVLSTQNPLPHVASFALSPLSGRAYVSSRMRLAKTQDVVILAELSSGKFIIGQRTVKVTIGGCGG
ncbi:MAG: thiosulfate oxidation carrier protein SoxY [Hyphomicrobiaceae bacterium]